MALLLALWLGDVYHFQNFVQAALAGDPQAVNCSPELGAAAMAVVQLGARSYREGKVFHFDHQRLEVVSGDASWASQWEARSARRGQPEHVPGWQGGDKGSVLYPKPYQALEGPWIDGIDPAARA